MALLRLPRRPICLSVFETALNITVFLIFRSNCNLYRDKEFNIARRHHCSRRPDGR
jgi:hypothetical protein